MTTHRRGSPLGLATRSVEARDTPPTGAALLGRLLLALGLRGAAVAPRMRGVDMRAAIGYGECALTVGFVAMGP